jgi:hypothetical protein
MVLGAHPHGLALHGCRLVSNPGSAQGARPRSSPQVFQAPGAARGLVGNPRIPCRQTAVAY